MPLSLVAPWFLLGLAAAVIPLLLHLRRARRVNKITFSTTRFFDEEFMRAARRARLQDILLMLLRMALFCLFALALSRPLLSLPGFVGLGVGQRNVAIVLDDSASMGVVTDKGTLLDRARQSSLAVLNDLSTTRGDRATVILAGRRDAGPTALFEEPTIDLEAVKQAVRQVKLTDLGTDIHAAVQTASKVLGADPADPGAYTSSSGAAREVYVFSDLQANAFAQGQGPGLGAGVGLFLVSVRADDATVRQNVSVDAVQYGSPRPVLGVPFTIRALVSNHSPRPCKRRVNLLVDGEVASHTTVDLPPARSEAVRFVHRFADAGWRSGHVAIESADDSSVDPLPVDDRRYFAVHVEQTVRTLAVNGAPSRIAAKDELFFFRLALTAVPEQTQPAGGRRVQIEQITAGELSKERMAPFPVVVLANVAGLSTQQLEMIEHYVDGGGNLLITLGDRVDAAEYGKYAGTGRLHGGLLPGALGGVVRSDDAAAFIGEVDSAHPAIAGFSDARLGYLASVSLDAWYDCDAQPSTVLMRSSTGHPLLAEKQFGRGRVLLFTSTLDRDWTNFPLQPTFVPWAYRLVSYLAQPSLDRSGFVRTGQVVHLPVSTTTAKPMQVTRPDGTIAYPQADVPGAAMILTSTDDAGVYAVRRSDQADTDEPRLLLAANVSGHESVPVYIDEQGFDKIMASDASWAYVSDPDAVLDAAEVAKRGYGLWDHLLILALLVGLFEPWVANRLARRRGGPAGDALDRRSIAPLQTDDATEAV